jgi:hypothetical protein
MLNRRGFIASIPALFVALKTFTVTLDSNKSATAYLLEAYNTHCKGKRIRPRKIQVSQTLFNAFESELTACMRFTDYYAPPTERSLWFKSACLYIDKSLSGWQYRITDEA